MKVVLADDSEIILDRLVNMLSEIENVSVVGTAQNSLTAYDIIMNQKPDLAILDIRMPGGDGIDLLKKIKKEKSSTKVIMLTNYNLPIYEQACINSGAEYFLDKSTEFEKIIEICNAFILNEGIEIEHKDKKKYGALMEH